MKTHHIYPVLLCCLWLILPGYPVTAGGNDIVPAMTVRVDTTQTNVRAVFNLVLGYLNSRPDSLYDNPFWSEIEKSKYPEPYCARHWLYPSAGITQSYPPRILSIEPERDYYCCRIFYYAENLEPPYAASNPWALQSLYAKLENNTWRLFDPIRVRTTNWPRTKIGRVEYIYPLDHAFNTELASHTAALVDSLATELGCPVDFDIEFYVEETLDGLNALVGLDFTLNVSAGRAMVPNHMILTSSGTEWYPHELVHVVINGRPVHSMLSEGIASLIGGTGEKNFAQLVGELEAVWERNDSLEVQDFLDQWYQEGSFTHYNAAGAVLCRAAIDKGGDAALQDLLFSGTTNEEFWHAVERVFGIDRTEVTAMVRAKTREYSEMELQPH